MAQYFDMGGYAAFVWPAYAIVALVMAGLVVATLRDLARQKRLLAALDGEGARKRAPARTPDRPA
ncbi:MAG: heme exporter protein CcmD [Parvibaculum sp.]|uniref:heme exporter protein CcmD n=1 Tax=Parvibaculum sp. TaxID=2024848 RepID=UPI0025E35C32|nr:heme exporter protein CcmD [Parvibaculum sp.]MCE9648358.1 heme exporter protein CcmD [Parvibaculum sp.]